MVYGIKKQTKDNGRITTIIKPKMEIRHDRSGYGMAKEKPYYVAINNQTVKRFKTEKSAVSFYKNYRKKVLKKSRELLK